MPRSREIDVLRDAAAGCGACDLVTTSTQTVFGEGPRNARHAAMEEFVHDLRTAVAELRPAGER